MNSLKSMQVFRIHAGPNERGEQRISEPINGWISPKKYGNDRWPRCFKTIRSWSLSACIASTSAFMSVTFTMSPWSKKIFLFWKWWKFSNSMFFRIGDCWPLRHRLYKKKGQIHSYPSRARMGWGNDKKGAFSFCLSVCCYVNLSVHPSVYWSAGNVWGYKWKNNHFTSFFFWIGCGGNLDVDGSWLLCPLICNDIVTLGQSLQDKLFKKKFIWQGSSDKEQPNDRLDGRTG